MKKRVEAIDFLRGISIIAIILLHIIHPLDFQPSTIYASDDKLQFFRDVLNFCIVSLIIASGFSLSYSTRKTEFKRINILKFFKKRTKRIFIPWFIYIAISFLIYGAIALIFPNLSARIFQVFPFFSHQSLWNIPIRWIILKWIIILIIMLSFLFPLLRTIYNKGKKGIIALLILYLTSLILYIKYSLNPYNYLDSGFTSLFDISLPILFFILVFVLGWSLVFIFGFYLETLFSKNKLRKKRIILTLIAIFSFVIILSIYNYLNLNIIMILNKTPPSPYYLLFGVSITLLLLTIFYELQGFMSKYKKFFAFFSVNSLWIFLWSYLTIIFISFIFSFFEINIYLKFVLEAIINIALLIGIVKLQNNTFIT